jgi:hypothetical protein
VATKPQQAGSAADHHSLTALHEHKEYRMAHGVTLEMRAIKRPAPEVIHESSVVERIELPSKAPDGKPLVRWVWRLTGGTYVAPEPSRDRSLPGKARRRARKAARALARRAFFKGHGVASENAYNLRYECPCGFGILAPLDDFEFMTDAMDHEFEHAEGVR